MTILQTMTMLGIVCIPVGVVTYLCGKSLEKIAREGFKK